MLRFKSFKARSYFAFGTIVFLSIILLLTVIRIFLVLDDLDVYDKRVVTLKNHIHSLKESENNMFLFDTKNKDFIQAGVSENTLRMDELQTLITEEVSYLIDHDLTKDYQLIGAFTKLNDHFQNYYGLIEDVKGKIQKRGFGSFNLAGELESSLNSLKVQSLLSEYEVVISEISNSIYDFSLVESNENADRILANIKAIIDSPTQGSSAFVNQFQALYDSFKEFAEISKEIGATGKQGIRAGLIKNADMILSQSELLEETVSQQVEKEKDLLYIGFSALAFLQVLIAAYFGFKLSTGLFGSINKIKSNITNLSAGVFPDRLDITSNDEIGVISGAINELTDRIEYAANYAREIGRGNLGSKYNENYSEDAIAKAIMEMQEKLKESAEIEKKRVWRTEGLSNFANILQENKDSQETLCFEVISNLVKHMNANQGAFYVVENKEDVGEVLKVVGAYAYEREKFLEVEIEKGDGMIGEVWKEGEMVVINEIPEDYFEITSGLGESLPNAIAMVPLIYNDEIFGLIEIASLRNFNEAELGFLEELSANIASTLSGTKVSANTKKLLEQSRQMQEEMKEQEEIMRQNIEEMQATQDTFDTREQAYQEEIKKLKNRIG